MRKERLEVFSDTIRNHNHNHGIGNESTEG